MQRQIMLAGGNNLLHLLTPDEHIDNIYQINPDHLQSLGIKGIITDMDNTLVPWHDRAVYPKLTGLFTDLKKKGFRIFIVSNNSRSCGIRLARELDISAIWYAIKPRRHAFRRAIKKMDLSPGEVAVVGDQIFTDILGGNRLGLHTILVNPISEKEFFWSRIMRKLERIILKRLEGKPGEP
ncbi:MAG: YqeG family HAD IIIA-type phosphatase [Bacillota bacterium]|nr:YqeG family HAD IIIA-type phosphatase [Bacillota bacterium]